MKGKKPLQSLIESLTTQADIEKLASACGNKIKEIINKNSKGNLPHSVLNKIIELSGFIDELIEKYEPNSARITNPYFIYYLTQVSRYNSMTNTVSETNDKRRDDIDIKININTSLPPIESRFLKQQGRIEIKVKIDKSEGSFKPIHVYASEETGHKKPQYYYRQKTTEKGQLHQDQKHYADDNAAIFKATQASNVARTGKNALKKILPSNIG